MAQEEENGSLCEIVVIENKKGLHARAAAKFVRLATTFNAEITVEAEEMKVSGLSIMGLMMLAAGKGSRLKLCASGLESEEAVRALSDLVKRGFDET